MNRVEDQYDGNFLLFTVPFVANTNRFFRVQTH